MDSRGDLSQELEAGGKWKPLLPNRKGIGSGVLERERRRTGEERQTGRPQYPLQAGGTGPPCSEQQEMTSGAWELGALAVVLGILAQLELVRPGGDQEGHPGTSSEKGRISCYFSLPDPVAAEAVSARQ